MTEIRTTAGGSADVQPKKQYKIGIPRALHFYKYYPIWKAFLENLGVKVVLSPLTNKEIMEQGCRMASGELCIPMKIYYGHVIELMKKHPDLDYIFVPRYVSLHKESYFCPKFMILPEVIKYTVKPSIKLLTLEVNAKNMQGIEGALKVGKELGFSQNEAGKAWVIAIDKFKSFTQAVKKEDYLEQLFGHKIKAKPIKQTIREDIRGKYPVTILLLGHAYNVYEKSLNMDMHERLKSMDCKVITMEMLPDEEFKKDVYINKVYRNYWGNCEEILQAARYFLTKGRSEIDGVLFLISFACGPDSLISELIMRDMKKRNIPFQAIIMDEHTGESGLVTRVESFVEMIRRKKYKLD